MGTPILPPPPPPIVPPGDDCAICWGPGKPFGELPTPNEIIVTVTGVEKGPGWIPIDGDPPEGIFVLPQVGGGLPCRFSKPVVPSLFVFLLPDAVLVFGLVITAEFWFNGITSGACITVIENQLNDHFANGTAVITIPEVS